MNFVPAWLSYVFVLLAAAGLFVVGFLHAAKRRTANLSARSMQFLLVRSGVLAVGLGFVAWYLNRTRGIGWMFVLFVVLALVLHYALTSTKWGKAVYAVGGNVEAARRAGINVRLVYASVLAICSTLAAFGGVLAAARLAAANQAVAAVTSTSTRSRPPSSVAPACSAAGVRRSPLCWACSSSSRSRAG